MPNTLRKSERLDKKKVIEKMFAGGSRSFSVFPLRVVYLPVEELEAPVSCKCFETPFQAGGEAQPRETPDT